MINQKPSQGIKLNNSHPLVKHLISCVVLNEYGSNIVNNYAMSKLTGDVTGATWQAGLKGSELDFSNSTSDVIDLGVPFLGSELTGLTVEMIVRINSTALGQMLAENGDAYNTNSFYLTFSSSDVFEFLVHDGSGTYSARSSSTAVAAGEYHHIVGVWTAGVNPPDLYLDGVLDNGTETGGSFAVSSLQDGNTNLEIGKRPSSTAVSFDGGIVFFRAYNKTLGANEIMQLYAQPYQMFDDWDYGFISVGGGGTSIISVQGSEFDLLALTQLLTQIQSVQGSEFALLALTQLLTQLQSVQGTEFALLTLTQLLTQIQSVQGTEFALLQYVQTILTSALLLAGNGDLIAPNFLVNEIIGLLEVEADLLPYNQTIENQLDLQGVLITILGFAGNTSILLLQNVVGSILEYSETLIEEIPVQQVEFDLIGIISNIIANLNLQGVEFTQLDFQFLIAFLMTLQGLEFNLLAFSDAIDFLNSVIYCIEKKIDFTPEILKHDDFIYQVVQGGAPPCL